MGEPLPQQNNVRTSTYCNSDTYDPAYKSLKNICNRTILVIGFLIISITSWGQTFWIGAPGGNWQAKSNWFPDVVPDANTDVYISTSATPKITSDAACRTIQISGILDIAVGNTLQVNGNWIADGASSGVTGGGKIIFTNGATIAPVNDAQIALLGEATLAKFPNVQINRAGGTLISLASAINIAGEMTLTNGTFNASGIVTINKDVTLEGGTFNAGTAIIEAGEAFLNSATTFNAGTSTVRFIGSSTNAQINTDEPFYDVEINKNGGSVVLKSNLTARKVSINSVLPATAPFASLIFSSPDVTANIQGTLQVTSGTIDMSASDNTYLNVAGSTTVDGGRIYINRLATTSALTLNGGLTVSAGSVEIGPASGAPALSKLKVVGNTVITGTGKFTNNTTATVDLYGNVLLGGGLYTAYNSKIEVTGNWQSNLAANFGPSTSTVKLIGNTNTLIQLQCRFANLTIEKSGGATVTNTSNLRIDQDLLVQSGTLILNNSGAVDMDLAGDLTIINGASLDMSNANIIVQLGGNLEDRNTAEPTNIAPRRGLYIGMNPSNPMGVRPCTSGIYTTLPVQLLPTIRFNGTTEQRITGYVPLRTYCGGFYPKNGIALPNIEINKTDTVRLNSDVNVRIHGNLNIRKGGFNLSSQILYFGDHENDEIVIHPTGVFTAPEKSQIFMNTGTTANGTFLKVNGGALRLLGKASNPVVITREGTVNQYYRMSAISGTVEAIYTTISYQGSSNIGFPDDPTLVADAESYSSAGGFKIYDAAVIDPDNLGYNFSYCVLGANAAAGTTSLTINTGQNLNIVGAIFNTSGNGGINTAKNNPLGVITFFRSSGELGGVNGEFYDGGYYADPAGTIEEGIVWETFVRIYWTGNTYDARTNTDATITIWSDPRNWSYSRTAWVNPNNIYPGQYPAPLTLGGKTAPADSLQQFEVFISASAKTSPILDGNYTIKGTLINNAVGRTNSFDLLPLLARNGKTLDLNGYTLTVWGDFVNNNRDAAGADLATNAIIKANPGGTIRFRANIASFHNRATINGGSGFVLEAFDSNPLQEIKVAENDLQEFTINKPEGRVVVQGFGTERLDVRRNLNILSGGMEMLTDTPLLVDGSFNISGGFFTFNSSIAIIRDNWINTGGVINTGGGVVYFYPSDNTTKIIRSGGQSFNQVNFGMINNSFAALATPVAPSPVSPGLTKYRVVDNFTATNLITIAARGEISRTTNPYTYNDSPAVSATNPAQPRIVEVDANVVVKANGMRVRENGELILKDGATLLINNNIQDFSIGSYNPFPAALNPLGLRVEGTAATFPNGKLTAIGTANNYVKISRNGINGVYNFKINGTLSNRYYLFEFMDENGVDLTAANSRTISPGTTLLPKMGATGTREVRVSSFSDGILTNGTIGGVYIKYSSNEAIFGAEPDTIYNVNFPVSLMNGTIGANIQRTGTACGGIAEKILWFRNATGAFAGEAFDNDGPFCRLDQIQWRQPQIRKWDGGSATVGLADKFWHNPLNWMPDGVPTPEEDVVLDHAYVAGSYTVNIEAATGDVLVNNLSIITKVENNNLITLTIAGAVNNERKLTVRKGFTIDVPFSSSPSGKLVLGDYSSMEVGENWSNKGSFVSNTTPVIFGAGYTGSRVIFNAKPTLPVKFNINPKDAAYVGPEPSKYSDNVFHKIIFKTGRTELNSDLLVKDSLIISSGAKLDNSFSSDPNSIEKGSNGINPNTILIEGNWRNKGRFLPTDGTVNFVGGLRNQILYTEGDTTTENFYNLKIQKLFVSQSNPYDVNVLSKATVSNELNLQQGRFITSTGNELILLTDNIIRNNNAFNTTAFVKGPLGQLYRGIGEIKHKFALGDKLWPGDMSYLTIKLTSSSTDKGTVFTMQQKDSDPDPSYNPDFPNDPAAYGDDRLLPKPLNYLSRSRYWNVKNIMFPVTKPVAGLNSDMQSGKLELPLAIQDENASVETANGWISLPNQTLDQVINELQELSIVQDTDHKVTDINPNYAPNDLSIQVTRGWADRGERWGDLGGELSVKDNGTKATYISEPFYNLGNGDFAFAWNYIPLPVEFLTLEANKKGETVAVKWITASEKGIVHYIVEKSTNGRQFVKIGEVQAKGKVTVPTTYHFTDASPITGICYYRLYSVDNYGTAQYSKTVAVSFDKAGKLDSKLVVFPNPFDGHTFNFSLDGNEGALQITLFDMLGKQVYTTLLQNYNHEFVPIEVSNQLSKGLYLLQITTEKGTYQKKLIAK